MVNLLDDSADGWHYRFWALLCCCLPLFFVSRFRWVLFLCSRWQQRLDKDHFFTWFLISEQTIWHAWWLLLIMGISIWRHWRHRIWCYIYSWTSINYSVDLVIIFNLQLHICLMVNLRDSCLLHSFVWSGPVLVSITGTGACIVIAQGHSKILALPIRFNGLRTEDSVP